MYASVHYGCGSCGHELVVDDVAAHAQLIGLMERGELEFAAVDAWLREHLLPSS